MAEACPQCGAVIPSDSPKGICPKCMYGNVLNDETLADDSETEVRSASEDGFSSVGDHGAQNAFLPGAVLAKRYRIVSLIGRGAMGEVYRADDLTLDQQVALKMLPDNLSGDETLLTALFNEVRQARRVTHPNVCRVHDLIELDGRRFLTMEYIDGEDLAALCRRIGRIPRDKAIQLSHQLCAGLSAAHREGVIHRDLKPANLMIDGAGNLKITDFGLARLAEDPKEQHISGTPSYMAPEQLLHGKTSKASDIYTLGLILFEMFTGERAHQARSLAALIQRHESSTQIRRPSNVSERDEPEMDEVILACAEPRPDRRPPSVVAVQAGLPGGVDPLAAALAAGETLQPEVIAAAGGRGNLSLRVGIFLLGTTLAGLVALAFALPRAQLFKELRPGDSAISDLKKAATDEVEALGLSIDDQHTAYGWATTDGDGKEELYFWYRSSPDPMFPQRGIDIAVSEFDPPWSPGMVNLRLSSMGEPDPDLKPHRPSSQDSGTRWITLGTMMASIALGLYHVNWRRGHRLGAFRIAVFVGIVTVVEWGFMNIGLDGLDPEYLIRSVWRLLALSALGWVYYIAGEPLIRRLWPETLIAWSRLLMGKWKDPLVSQSLLFGVATGVIGALLWQGAYLVPEWVGVPGNSRLSDTAWSVLGKPEVWFAEVAGISTTAVFYALGMGVGLAISVAIFRSRKLACFLYLSAMTLLTAEDDLKILGVVLYGGMIALLIILFVRLGLLPLAVAVFVIFLCVRMPLTYELGAWYAPYGLAAAGLVFAMALYGFLASTPSNGLMRKFLFEEGKLP